MPPTQARPLSILEYIIRKIGDRHCMLNLFQHAVTIAFFVYFAASAHLGSKITRFCSYFYQRCHNINKNMIPLASPLQEGMGEAFLAPQGAAPALPLQEGMGEASLGPPHDVIALGVGRRLVDARASGRLRRAHAPRGGGRCLAP